MDCRITPEQYYIKLAQAASLRSTCERAKVGCILVSQDDAVLGTGYNGSLPNYPHCNNKTDCLHNGHCIKTTHAEVNAIERATSQGHKLKDAIAYCTHRPCYSCSKMLAAFGIRYIFYHKMYEDDAAAAYFDLVGMHVHQVQLRD